MELKPVRFLGAYPDGLLEIDGEAFTHAGREWAVHKRRAPYSEYDQRYQVSDVETGFCVPKVDSEDKLEAIRMAVAQLDRHGQKKIDAVIEKAKAIRAELPKVML